MAAKDYTYDDDMQLQDSVLVAASVVGKVATVATVLDLGPGRVDAVAVIDVTTIEIASNDEVYTILVEGASEVAMDTTLVPLAELQLGALEVLGPGSSRYLVDSVIGRYELKFTNERGGVTYPYIRLYTIVAGTIASGITFECFVGIEKN